jgi:hypothetical protein
MKISPSIFEGIAPTVEVVATIAYVGDHWATTWWCIGWREWFFAEGLNYSVKATQYKFRDWVEEHFMSNWKKSRCAFILGRSAISTTKRRWFPCIAALLPYVSCAT